MLTPPLHLGDPSFFSFQFHESCVKVISCSYACRQTERDSTLSRQGSNLLNVWIHGNEMCKNSINGIKTGIVQVKFVIGQQVSSSLLQILYSECLHLKLAKCENIWDIFIVCRILMSGDIDPRQQWWNEKQLMMCVSSCGIMSAWWNLWQNCPSGVSVFGASFTTTALC